MGQQLLAERVAPVVDLDDRDLLGAVGPRQQPDREREPAFPLASGAVRRERHLRKEPRFLQDETRRQQLEVAGEQRRTAVGGVQDVVRGREIDRPVGVREQQIVEPELVGILGHATRPTVQEHRVAIGVE